MSYPLIQLKHGRTGPKLWWVLSFTLPGSRRFWSLAYCLGQAQGLSLHRGRWAVLGDWTSPDDGFHRERIA